MGTGGENQAQDEPRIQTQMAQQKVLALDAPRQAHGAPRAWAFATPWKRSATGRLLSAHERRIEGTVSMVRRAGDTPPTPEKPPRRTAATDVSAYQPTQVALGGRGSGPALVGRLGAGRPPRRGSRAGPRARGRVRRQPVSEPRVVPRRIGSDVGEDDGGGTAALAAGLMGPCADGHGPIQGGRAGAPGWRA